MKTIAAAKFKERCLKILDEVPPDGLTITKHGSPVATLLPAKKSLKNYIGSMKGKLYIKGDIFSTGIKWDAES